VNRLHHWLCSSSRWRKAVKQRVPWVLESVELRPNVLELGPGPGLTTVRLKAQHLTAIEVDPRLAGSLRSRLCDSNVEVITGDATAMPFSDGRFSSAVGFTMLHHVPSRDLQDKLLREAWRVIEPGGLFVGCDSLQNPFMRLIHLGDTLVPVDPNTFAARLEAAGFHVLKIEKNSEAFRFQAQRLSARR